MKVNNYEKYNIKEIISSIIQKQLNQRLMKLELKNKNEINETQIITQKSNELIEELSHLSYKVKKKINLKKNNIKLSSSKNILKSNSQIILNKKYQKKSLYNNNNKFKNLYFKKNQTPIKNINTISILNLNKCKSSKIPNISLDRILIKNKKNNNNNRLGNIKTNNNKNKIRKYSKDISIKRKKKKILKYFSPSEDKSITKNNIYNYINDLDIDNISINFEDEQRISQIDIYKSENNIDKDDKNSKRLLSLKLGPLIETIENEKRINFLSNNLFKNDTNSRNEENIVKYSNYNENIFPIIIEYIFEYLYIFLDTKSFFNFLIINKEYFKLLITLLITKKEENVNHINKILTELKKNNNFLNFKDNKIKTFEYNINSNRAISLLNTITVENFFNEENINFKDKKVSLIFDLYFISIGKKIDVIEYNFNNKLRQKYIINHFKLNNKKNIGIILDSEIKNILFNDEIINSLYNYSYNYINLISPTYLQKINKNIALISFLIKNILENIGITKDFTNNNNLKKFYQLYCSRLNINKEIIKRLKKIKDLY